MNAILVSEIDELLKNGNRAKAVRARGMAEAAIELHREDPIFHLKAAEAWNNDYSVFVKDYFERLDIPDEERIIDVVAEDRGENGEFGRRSVRYRIQYLHDDTGQVLSTGGDLQFSKSGADWKIDQMKYLLF